MLALFFQNGVFSFFDTNMYYSILSNTLLYSLPIGLSSQTGFYKLGYAINNKEPKSKKNANQCDISMAIERRNF